MDIELNENMTFNQLVDYVKKYNKNIFRKDVEWAVRHAQRATRAYVERLHPARAFRNKKTGEDIDIRRDNYNNHTHNQILKGTFNPDGASIKATIFSNYYARFLNTGAYGLIIRSGKYKGRRGPNFYPKEENKIYVNNKDAIKKYYLDEILAYLQKHKRL